MDTKEEYRPILQNLRATNISYMSHNLTEDKQCKFVVRRLPLNTDPNLVKLELRNVNFTVKSIIELTVRLKANHLLTLLFYVQTTETEDFTIWIYELTELL